MTPTTFSLSHMQYVRNSLLYFHIVRILLIVWSMVMVSAVESVAIRTKGKVELENTSRDAYAQVLTFSVGSFLGDAAFALRRRKRSVFYTEAMAAEDDGLLSGVAVDTTDRTHEQGKTVAEYMAANPYLN